MWSRANADPQETYSMSKDPCRVESTSPSPDPHTGTRCRWLLGVLAMAWMVLSTSVPRAQSDLVAAYAMNEGSGTILADWTGKGRTGTLSGAAWTPAGRFGGALSFDGVNDWVTVADAADLDLTTGLTLEAWVYPTVSGGGSWRNVLIKERTAGEVYNLYTNADTNAPTAYVVTAGNPGTALDARGTSALPLNSWSCISDVDVRQHGAAFVCERRAGREPCGGRPAADLDGVLRLGGNSIWGEYFAGVLDEVRIYNRARTVSEIQTDMNVAVGAPDTTAPTLSGGAPSGVLAAGTTATTLSLATNENASCRYATSAGVAYGSMPSVFTTTGGVAPRRR